MPRARVPRPVSLRRRTRALLGFLQALLGATSKFLEDRHGPSLSGVFLCYFTFCFTCVLVSQTRPECSRLSFITGSHTSFPRNTGNKSVRREERTLSKKISKANMRSAETALQRRQNPPHFRCNPDPGN